MKIPYVIDNKNHRLVDVLNGLLVAHQGRLRWRVWLAPVWVARP